MALNDDRTLKLDRLFRAFRLLPLYHRNSASSPVPMNDKFIGPVGLHMARGPRAAKLVVAVVRSATCSNSHSLSTARAVKAANYTNEYTTIFQRS